MRKLVKPSVSDPVNSVDLYDADKLNNHDEMFCVAAAIRPEEVDYFWSFYAGEPKPEANLTPAADLQTILNGRKKVFEGPAQEGAEAGFQHGLKKAYDDLNRAAEWD